jgi:hypothetical protein
MSCHDTRPEEVCMFQPAKNMMPDRITKGHGTELRGANRVYGSSIDEGRFGRLFRWLMPADFTEAALRDLSDTMVQGEFTKVREENKTKKENNTLDKPIDEPEEEDENPTVPAGYTYLGQFIDHDITFDPISSLAAASDPDALHNFRTPRLDLDSMYGMGPSHQPYMYADDFKLLLGDEKAPPGGATRPDLHRNNAPVRRALTGDKRNDENTIVSQLHSVFIRFHNAVVDHLLQEKFPHSRLFAEAQRIVRWHYQWVVMHDYVPAIVGEHMAKAVLNEDSDRPDLRLYKPRSGAPFMPIEFSVAAFRFGHSMVRPSYALNTVVPGNNITQVRNRDGGTDSFSRIPVFSFDSNPLANLNGFREVPNFWGIDWKFFFDFGGPKPKPGQPQIPQPSYRMDTLLVDPLADLPEFVKEMNPHLRSLAFRNLMRGWRLGLPSGQDVARLIDTKHPPLTDDELFNTPERKAVYNNKDHKDVFYKQAPLWYYILREAENTRRDKAKDPAKNDKGKSLGGHHLGIVGGRIVAEVLVGLVYHDHYSYMHLHPGWKPELSTDGHFSMVDIINFADNGSVNH